MVDWIVSKNINKKKIQRYKNTFSHLNPKSKLRCNGCRKNWFKNFFEHFEGNWKTKEKNQIYFRIEMI